MKKGIFKKLFTGALACMMCLTAIPSEPDTLAAADRCDQGQQDGYDWELWNQWDQGTANMQLLGNGTFSCEWSGIENVLFRTGKKWTSNSPQWDTLDGITMDYAADYQPNGNSYLSVYGWTKSPLVEYYIIESWGTWRPPGGTGYKDTITVDGVEYDVYQTIRNQQPSIEGTKTFPQYFSVRKEGDKSTSGTVDIAKHFAAWENLGLDMGGLYEVSLVVEGYQSSGKATVTKNNITIGGGFDPNEPTTPVEPVEPDENGYYFHSTYESGTDNWSARGSNSAAVSGSASAAGSKSLFVSDRTEAWNGAGYSLNKNAFVPGNSYSFSTMVMQNSSASEDMKLSLQYDDASGEPQYATIAEATASKGEWTQLKNTNFKIPSGASNMLLYVETPENLIDFYIDEAIGAVGGTAISPTGGSSTTTPDEPDEPDTPVTPDNGDYYFHSTYESDEDGWASRGDTTLQLSGKNPYAGKNSLLVSGRTDAWNGAGYTLSSSVFKPGSSYSFSAMAMQDTETSVDFKLSLQYDDASGEPQYATIAEATGTKGNWTQLANTNFQIPSDASNMLLYVETSESLTNFYMDEAIGAAAGTVIDADIKASAGDVNEDSKLDANDLTALRDFIMGKSSSASAETSDLDGNGRVDSLDLAALRKLLTTPATDDTNNNNNNNNNTTTTPGVTDISWIDTSKPMVALSFDDGPISTAENSAPIRIQNALSENGFHATFFYWGERITSANEAEITRAYNLGFEVANHTYTHPYLTNLSADGIKQEIQKTADILTRLTGQTKFLIRPPYLAVNSTVQQNAGAPLITCNVDSQDWNGASSQQIIDTIVSKMNDGSLDNSIVLMHENYDSTATAIEYLVPYLKQNGWQVVTISEMFMANNKTMVDGTVYSSAN